MSFFNPFRRAAREESSGKIVVVVKWGREKWVCSSVAWAVKAFERSERWLRWWRICNTRGSPGMLKDWIRKGCTIQQDNYGGWTLDNPWLGWLDVEKAKRSHTTVITPFIPSPLFLHGPRSNMFPYLDVHETISRLGWSQVQHPNPEPLYNSPLPTSSHPFCSNFNPNNSTQINSQRRRPQGQYPHFIFIWNSRWNAISNDW